MTTTARTLDSRWSGWTLVAWMAAAWLAGAGPARAACTVALVSNVAFGAYNVFSPSPLDTTGVFQYRCWGGDRPNLRITITRGGSTTFQPRRMQNGQERIDYNLYLTAARTAVWGDETEMTQAYYARWLGGNWVDVTVYGRIPAGQDAAAGAYVDAVTVVVNF